MVCSRSEGCAPSLDISAHWGEGNKLLQDSSTSAPSTQSLTGDMTSSKFQNIFQTHRQGTAVAVEILMVLAKLCENMRVIVEVVAWCCYQPV